MDSLTIGSIAGSLGIFFIYHLYYWTNIFNPSLGLIQLNYNLKNALIWISKHKEKDDAPSVTLAIQTLRNTILVAIFVGGSSFQFSLNLLNSLTPSSDALVISRNIILSTILFFSFLCWTNVIRFANHLGYVIGTMEYKEKSEMTKKANALSIEIESDVEGNTVNEEKFLLNLVEECIKLNHRMLINFSLGFRFLYVSIPYMFLSAGPIALIISSGFIFLFLLYIDYSNVFNIFNCCCSSSNNYLETTKQV